MKKSKISVNILLSLAIILTFGGCQSRSVSSISGYSDNDGYRGELNELSVLGVRIDENVTDSDISAVLAAREGKPVVLKRGDVLAVIQSGARFPDKEMSDPLETLSKVVPLSGRVIPDETQHVQIRVKAALIDVATGNWTMIRTEPMQDKRMSSRLTRDSSDLKQIMRLKEKAYAQFAEDLKARFLL